MASRLTRSLLVLALLGLFALSGQSLAQDNSFDGRLAAWNAALDSLEDEIEAGDITEERFEAIRETLLAIVAEARQAAGTVRSTMSVTQQMIDALGPPPAEGASPEPEVLAKERQRLQDSLAAYQGQQGQAELAATRASILLSAANAQRIAILTETLLLRGPSPFDPDTWAVLPDQIAYLEDLLLDPSNTPVGELPSDELRLGLIAACVIGFGVGIPLSRWLHRRFGHGRSVEAPTYRERVLAAVVEAVVRGLLPAIATLLGLFVLAALVADHPLARALRPAVEAGAIGLMFFFFSAGLINAILAPRDPKWRIAEVAEDAAGPLSRRFATLAATLGAAGATVILMDDAALPAELLAVIFFALVVLTALALFSVLPGHLWRRQPPAATTATLPTQGGPLSDGAPSPAGEPEVERGAWPRLRGLALIVGIAAIGASALGYHGMARYIGQLFFAGTALAGFVLLLRGILREMMQLFLTTRHGRVASWRRMLFPRERGLRFFEYVVLALLDIFLFFLWLGLLVPVTGIAWSEARSWLSAAAEGFSIGGFVLRPTDILLAILAFFLALTVTRFLQRRLDDRVLSKLQIDRGVQNSITTGIGYVGVIIAIVIGVMTLGLDLSNLALIAGALSVGIGFGLQNVVQNFVAGLILLVERPIKVGDSVTVGPNSGVVKRISVRATEIQTGQRASVIIPNADLVAQPVINLTHKDKVGRVDVAVNVAYGSDLKLVRETLQGCAEKCQHVLRYPAPLVVFRDFGQLALEFQVWAYVADIDNSLSVSNELRYRIADSFAERGIVMPYGHRSLEYRQLAALRQQSAKAAEQDEPEEKEE
jgi:potassium-dependent mechanosensitive channel